MNIGVMFLEKNILKTNIRHKFETFFKKVFFEVDVTCEKMRINITYILLIKSKNVKLSKKYYILHMTCYNELINI